MSYVVQRENPKIPPITVHDSFTTTAEHLEYLKAIIEEELEKAIGFKPKLATEFWGIQA